jgi:hypothetical protein
MYLTGPAHGAPLVPGVDVMSGVRALLQELQSSAAAVGAALQVDPGVLTERAQLMHLGRGGSQSCNRSCRLLEVRDGWIALNLPRAADKELLPAWLGIEAGNDPWPAIERTVRRFNRSELASMCDGLSLAVAAVPSDAAASIDAQAQESLLLRGTESTTQADCGNFAPLVVDLSALWAGPLCGQLLRRAGARVIKVESAARPEPMRRVWPRFFDRLNAGKESLVLEFDQSAHRARLKRLLASADIVISSARPRAFEQLGLEPTEFFRQKPALIWIAITAHGWHGAARHRVGFGDDAAAAAGLLATTDDGRPAFLGDAIADPLTGIAAASTALSAWRHAVGGLYDMSLQGTARRVAAARRLSSAERGAVCERGNHWWLCVDGQEVPVTPPRAGATINERAALPGAHTLRTGD